MFRIVRVFLLLAGGLAVQAADKIVGGPYTINVGPRSATVAWLVQSSEARLGTEPDKLAKVAPVLRVEKVSYTGLEAGKTYYYQAFGQGEEGKGRFQTPPAGPVPFQFVVYGDTRSRHDVHARVAQAIAKAEPDFVLHTGDLVADGTDSAQWPVFFSTERDLLRKTAFFPSLGNHERNSRQYYEFFDVQLPYYSFDWGNAHIAVLNTDLGNLPRSREVRDTYWKEELRWLEEDLARGRGADFVFVIFHHPPFTAVKRRQGGDREVMQVVPLMEKYKVSAVLNGHDHNYQHHLKDGVRYIVTGGGGAPLYDVDAPLAGLTQKLERVEHYVGIQVNGKSAKIQAFAVDGRVIDTIDLKSRAEAR
ncbi:MAG: metallophosphoesterase [Acidobacteria bacterium]|nr:metallophosphoesterase [Acidobacteriota bacterium]